MKDFDWDEDKNKLLKSKRNISFEEVVDAFHEEKVLDDVKHPNPKRYPNQRIMIIAINDYVYLVPYIESEDKVFLKTIIPNRKATKKYLRKEGK